MKKCYLMLMGLLFVFTIFLGCENAASANINRPEKTPKYRVTQYIDHSTSEPDTLKVTYEYDSNGNISIIRMYFSKNGTDYSTSGGYSECSYDQNGNKIRENFCKADGSFSIYDEFEYNADNMQTKWTTYMINTMLTDALGYDYYDEMSSITYEYEYDTDGNLIKDITTETDSEGNTEMSGYKLYEYDQSNKLVRKDVFSRRGMSIEQSSIVTYFYDSDNGNLIKTKAYIYLSQFNDDTPQSSIDYEYDSNNCLVKKSKFNKYGSLESYTVYEYEQY